MFRLTAFALCFMMVLESGATASAGPVRFLGGALLTSLYNVIADVTFAPAVRKTQIPARLMPDYADASRYVKLIPKGPVEVRDLKPPRPFDLVKLQREQRGRVVVLHTPLKSTASQLRVRRRLAIPHSLQPSTTGIMPWWTYQVQKVPGLGQAMANVTNLNVLIEATDVDVPFGGLDLAFRRVYNSQSTHDANGDDGSTPSVFGNKWTNTLDTHIGWSSAGSNTGIVSVYTPDGAREDYSCEINVQATCTSETPGVYDLLATGQPVVSGGGVACWFQWTKKTGTTYLFFAPYKACTSNPAGYYGKLWAIYARNESFSVDLTYGWTNNDASNPENIATIRATHFPDGGRLTLTFGQIAGSAKITELMSMARPDMKTTIDYQYDALGNLVGVDKPGDNPVLQTNESVPTTWGNGTTIPAGNLPEVYDIGKAGNIDQACGPRGAITSMRQNTSNDKADGACFDFDYTSGQLADWYTEGVLDPTPRDNVSPSPIQANETGWQPWFEATFSQFALSGCHGTTTQMYDQLGHLIQWCVDAAGRVTKTSMNVGGTTWIATSAQWDSNNDLVSTTDARSNTTQMAYDENGNTVEVSHPSELTSQGTISPTSFYDYDVYNNLVHYCDPANNSHNSWIASNSDGLCAEFGTHYAIYTYTSDSGPGDPNEPYGCLTDTYKPGGYHTQFKYQGGSGPCGVGLPTKVIGQSIQQDDKSTRQLNEILSYNNDGTLYTFDPGDPHQSSGNGLWTVSYATDGMARIRSVEDPDGVTSYRCYDQDGSLFYSETQHQYTLDGSPGCPSLPELLSGVQPPKYAVAYSYDPDSNVATETHHHNCGVSCLAAVQLTSWCTPTISVAADTACNYYDGSDRLVEVKQAYDSNAPDMYVNPWITRYLYDLTGGQYNFAQSPTFSAYGNLFETQELLPPGSGSVTTTVPPDSGYPTPPPNVVYQPIKGAAFDGLDRPVKKYSLLAGGSSEELNTETLTWDTSPLDSGGVEGLLGKDCNGAGQCQQFDYTADGQEMTFASSDGSSPTRSYEYDPDSRVASIKSGSHSPLTYIYDKDGNLMTATDSDQGSSPATLNYHYYPDGIKESLDVASSALTQVGLFSYSYYSDGPLKTEVIDDSSLGSINGFQNAGKTTLAYTYTNNQRLLTRTETGAGAYLKTQTSKAYNASGFENAETNPGTTFSGFSYSAESELLGMTSSNPGGCNGGPPNSISYSYSLRGELSSWPACTAGNPNAAMANGLTVSVGAIPNSIVETTWDDRMPSMTRVKQESNCGGGTLPLCSNSSWGYDDAGRLTSEGQVIDEPNNERPRPQEIVRVAVTAIRCYDAENHVQISLTTAGSGGTCNAPPVTTTSTSWGGDGHPITIGTYDSGGTLHNETLHWSGDQLLFTTRSVNGNARLDDIKVDVQGDILPYDSGYQGLTFYDRSLDGTVMGCHNASGVSFLGVGPPWNVSSESPCLTNETNKAQMPTTINWSGQPFFLAKYRVDLPMGQGGALGMPRPDGFTDDFDTIQGVRAYDSAAGLWTAPDVFGGVVADPASQKSYMWSGNNPVAYSDPSGYITYVGNAWASGVDLLFNVHAFVQVIENGMNVSIEYGNPNGYFGAVERDPYGSSVGSFSDGKPIVLVSTPGGLTGSALDMRVLQVFGQIDQYLYKYDTCYCEFNSNSVVAAGLLMLGYTPEQVGQMVHGPGAFAGPNPGDAIAQGEELANRITAMALNAFVALGLMGSNGLDYCGSCGWTGMLR
jgi:YD repeat-containing protein